jgi:hypothetical protein
MVHHLRGTGMKALPKTHTQKLYICGTRQSYPKTGFHITLLAHDPHEYGNPCGFILLGDVEVTVDIPACDPLRAEVAALEKARDHILSAAKVQATRLDQQIQQLLCLEHQVHP